MQVRGCSSGARPFLKLYSYHPRSCRGCSGSSNIDVNGVATRIRIQDHCNQNSFICAAFINRSVMLYSKPISICFYSRLELYFHLTMLTGVSSADDWCSRSACDGELVCDTISYIATLRNCGRGA